MHLKIRNEQLVNGTIPSELLVGVTELEVWRCPSLTTLPNLPAGITYLDLSLCSKLTTLPNLPVGITYLNLLGCQNLTTLPNLPAGITYLDLRVCEKLDSQNPIPQELIERLVIIKSNGAEIYLPKQLEIEVEKQLLVEIIQTQLEGVDIVGIVDGNPYSEEVVNQIQSNFEKLTAQQQKFLSNKGLIFEESLSKEIQRRYDEQQKQDESESKELTPTAAPNPKLMKLGTLRDNYDKNR